MGHVRIVPRDAYERCQARLLDDGPRHVASAGADTDRKNWQLRQSRNLPERMYGSSDIINLGKWVFALSRFAAALAERAMVKREGRITTVCEPDRILVCGLQARTCVGTADDDRGLWSIARQMKIPDEANIIEYERKTLWRSRRHHPSPHDPRAAPSKVLAAPFHHSLSLGIKLQRLG